MNPIYDIVSSRWKILLSPRLDTRVVTCWRLRPKPPPGRGEGDREGLPERSLAWRWLTDWLTEWKCPDVTSLSWRTVKTEPTGGLPLSSHESPRPWGGSWSSQAQSWLMRTMEPGGGSQHQERRTIWGSSHLTPQTGLLAALSIYLIFIARRHQSRHQKQNNQSDLLSRSISTSSALRLRIM